MTDDEAAAFTFNLGIAITAGQARPPMPRDFETASRAAIIAGMDQFARLLAARTDELVETLLCDLTAKERFRHAFDVIVSNFALEIDKLAKDV